MCTFAALIIACSRPSFAVKKTSHSHIISTSKCVNGRREENSRLQKRTDKYLLTLNSYFYTQVGKNGQ